MFKIPCKQGNTILSIVSFIFLSTSAVGLSLTIHDDQNMPFLKENSQVLIPFLSTVCGISSLLFIYTFLDIQFRYKYCCIRCCYNTNDNIFNDDNYQNESLYDEVNTNIGVQDISNSNNKKETDPLLYPKLYPELTSDSINIPKQSRI